MIAFECTYILRKTTKEAHDFFIAPVWGCDSECDDAGSIPRSRLKIHNWVAPLWLVFILYVSHSLID